MDSLSKIEKAAMIDRVMKHYFGTDNWLEARNTQFPALGIGKKICGCPSCAKNLVVS